MSRPTIAGVARAAGVSVASVSRVLNGLPATEEMIERVQRAVDALGYVPDSRARSLKVGRTFQLTLAVADVGNPGNRQRVTGNYFPVKVAFRRSVYAASPSRASSL